MITEREPLANAKRQIQSHAVIILASGLSQRLGQPKQLLSKNTIPLISYMIEQALSTQPRTVVVIIPKDYPVISKAIIKDPVIHTIMNPIPEAGMAHSLHLGIEALADFADKALERVLIMGIDQVLLDDAHLRKLLVGHHNVVASRYHNWQPLPKLSATKLHKNDFQFRSDPQSKIDSQDSSAKSIIGLPLVIDYPLLRQWQPALNGDKGLRYLIRALAPNQLETITNAQLSYDIDTPEQLNYARKQGWLDN